MVFHNFPLQIYDAIFFIAKSKEFDYDIKMLPYPQLKLRILLLKTLRL